MMHLSFELLLNVCGGIELLSCCANWASISSPAQPGLCLAVPVSNLKEALGHCEEHALKQE